MTAQESSPCSQPRTGAHRPAKYEPTKTASTVVIMTHAPEPKPKPCNGFGCDNGESSEAPIAVPSTLMIRYTIEDRMTPAIMEPQERRGSPS
jgi:hypothetical protein